MSKTCKGCIDHCKLKTVKSVKPIVYKLSKEQKAFRQSLIDEACHDDTDILIFLEGPEFDVAIIGICYQEGPEYCPPRIAYDIDKIIDVFMSQGMSEDEAWEFYDYNTVRALPYMGKSAPVLIKRIESKK